ncbi:MAG: OsmC family protein [Burkholderiales bacterium]|nr:OsmC family protein [Burkholderiales bacterium]
MAKGEILITRHGKPAGVPIGFDSEDDWFDYRLENDPVFLQRIASARESPRSGRGTKLDHSKVEPMDGCGVVVPIGTHAAVGGPHDGPTPGDIPCAALAACQDSTMRLVANLLGVELTSLEVSVIATVDVRGAMAVGPGVPVGFQTMTCNICFKARVGTPPELLEKLKLAAERCCIVQQTLKSPPPVKTTFITSGPAQ